MKHIARFNGLDFDIINNLPKINNSSKEIKLSNLKLDFNGVDIDLLPLQYQEIKIIRINDDLSETVIQNCYCNKIKFPNIIYEDTLLHIEISLFPPSIICSKRTIQKEIKRTSIKDGVTEIVEPLLTDGFTIAYNDLSETKTFADVYNNETVEKILNELSNRKNFIWYVNEKKELFFKNLDLLETKEADLIINGFDGNDYLSEIKPYIETGSFANKCSLSNYNLIFRNNDILAVGTVLEPGATYTLSTPVSISENVSSRAPVDFTGEVYPFSVSVSGPIFYIIEYLNDEIVISSNIGFDGEDNNDPTKKILLIRDGFEKTKITGIKFNGTTSETVTSTQSNCGLLLSNYKIEDPFQIDKLKDIINTSGVIEKTIDLKGKYFNDSEITDYAISQLGLNNNQNKSVDMTFTGEIEDAGFNELLDNTTLGNVIEINFPFVSGKFVVTKNSYEANTAIARRTIKAQTFNFVENYLDIFRKSKDNVTEDNIKNNTNMVYSKEEELVYNYEVLVDGEVVNNV